MAVHPVAGAERLAVARQVLGQILDLFQLLGLHWSGADRSVVSAKAQALLAAQRPDGGWAQLPSLSSDAYATGEVGVCMATSGPGATNLVTALADANMDSVPLVAVTGYGQDEDRRQSREAGFDHHLTKPVDPQALQVLIANPPLH